MGRFVNPDNHAFQVALNSEIYIDKTELLSYTNKVLDTNNACICNSRPRRFGKSITADMLTAYYSKGCDSRHIFDGKEISKDETFQKHLNRYNVIHFDVQWCRASAGSAEATVSYMEENIIRELKDLYPDLVPEKIYSLADILGIINNAFNQKFIIIIDEWDILIREDREKTAVQEEYINFLRGLLKGSQPTRFLHLAFLTGILPIKKWKTESALNNFDEFTMLDPSVLAPYMGFTEEEVKGLCQRYNQNFETVKYWYDGYLLSGCHVYNPKAVVNLMMRGEFQSYWSQTGTYESILPLINMDFDGLKKAIFAMLSGDAVKVKTTSYQNDMITFKSKDDILTALVHLGYLAFDRAKQTVFIPNEEIRSEFVEAVEENDWNELNDLQMKSEELLDATLDMDGKKVAEIIEEIHMDYSSAIQYNDENSLSSVLSIAYLASMKYYYKPVRELPTGRGFADLVFLPRKEYSDIPAFIVELKWNKSANAAIRQIKDRQYTKVLEHYTGEVLLVGIAYDKKKTRHTCVIEKYTLSCRT